MAKSKFTTSKDGIKRTSVRFEFRFTEQEIEDLKKIAHADGENDWRVTFETSLNTHMFDWMRERLEWINE